MKTRKLFVIRSLCVLVLVGAIVAGILQHGAIAKANIERQALLRDGEEVDRLMQENAEMAQLRATNHDLEVFRPRQRELARLRNEVGQLRTQAAEVARLLAENQRLSSPQGGAMPAGFVSRAAMSDVGLGTPEDAIQSYFFAMLQGNVKRMNQCSATEEELTAKQEEERSGTLLRQFASFPGFFIGETKIISPDEEQIGVQAIPGGVIYPIHLVRTGNEWNVK